MLNSQRFCDLWQRLCCRGDGFSQFAALERAYAEPHRAYHTGEHIENCLRQLDWARHLALRPDDVEATIWFHDAVYDPRAADNEQKSAAWAKEALGESRAEEAADRVASLIMLTRHGAEPDSRDGELLLDIDLSVLGRDPDMFAVYDAQIRKEYAWVPESDYRRGRAAVLEQFLSRSSIFRTPLFRERFEFQARRNLQAVVAALRQ